MKIILPLFLIIFSFNLNAQSVESNQLENDIMKMKDIIQDIRLYKNYIIENDLLLIEYFEVFEYLIGEMTPILDRIERSDFNELDEVRRKELRILSKILFDEAKMLQEYFLKEVLEIKEIIRLYEIIQRCYLN
jgi:hypothetical protein